MASNRHWPSMFKSKPTNTNQKTPYTSALPAGTEERAPDPKPRWHPRPEQIRILEGIFNSGMVNPTRDDLRRIRVQLQEFGQVGDANVFYWFQNRKSRNKQKQRQLLQNYTPRPPAQAADVSTTGPNSSSSSSSNNSNYEKALPVGSPSVIDLLNNNNNNNNNSSNNNSLTVSVDQPMTVQAPLDFPNEPSFSLGLAKGFCFPDDDVDRSGSLVNELVLMSKDPSKKAEDDEKMKMKTQTKDYFAASPSLLGSTESSLPKPIVFINDTRFEIGMGPFNVRETFGDAAVLLHSTGQTVPTNEWGLTHQPLRHGASYYLLRPLTASPGH